MKQAQLNELKALVNNIIPEPETKKLTALKSFPSRNGYGITRTKNQVIFGCGEVKVNKYDLLVVANFLESRDKFPKAIARLLAAYRKHNNTMQEANITEIGVRKLRQLVG